VIDEPRTKEEAEKRRYGQWAGSKGYAYNPQFCAASVWDNIRTNQCSRKPGHGPDGLYCKQHDPDALKAKRDARNAKWKAENAARDARWDAAAAAVNRLGTGTAGDGRVLLSVDQANALADELGRAK